MKDKALYKVGDKFFHPEQQLFLVVNAVEFYKTRGGYLYRMEVFNTTTKIDKSDPWKSYYQSKVIKELVLLKDNFTTKVLYGNRRLANS